MREIKFRAKRIRDKEFYYGWIVYDEEGLYLDNGRGCKFAIDEKTIGQFTGLTDKNGTPIYEGDIVKIPNDWEEYGWMAGEIREVYYCEGGFRYKPKYDERSRGHWLESEEGIRVLGNIHEHPHLLNAQHKDGGE